jgi:hypothetical protein
MKMIIWRGGLVFYNVSDFEYCKGMNKSNNWIQLSRRRRRILKSSQKCPVRPVNYFKFYI